MRPGRTDASPHTTAEPAPASDQQAPFRLGYRPELDGIRAIAIALVLCYHIGVLLLSRHSRWIAPGGFLGVDVFFVLSGFLITVLLLGEWERSGGIAEGAFLRRRALRLLPALAAMLVLISLWLALTRWSPASQALGTIPWGLTYLQNWSWGFLNWPHTTFAFQTWSLAIEGQFYVGWSLLLVALCRLRAPRWSVAVFAAVGVVGAASWRAVRYSSGHNWLRVYIQTPTRIDSLMVGAIAGVAVVSGWTRTLRPSQWRVVGAVGLVAVFASAWMVRDTTPALYDGLYTVVACAAAALLLGVALGGVGPLHDVLASRPFVTVGKLSYSLYLWHFPIFLMFHDHGRAWSAPARVFVPVMLTVTMSALSYRFVELPFLRRKRPRPTAVEAEPRILVASSDVSLRNTP